ncbi:MAG TPA: RagB/SusD family nutrient uptake outer membrane protein [Chitinophagaceae bacterium]|nr:RagB/SusD family nutrient uptake outer membrane protein [Chitinophagaceae bacterium]
MQIPSKILVYSIFIVLVSCRKYLDQKPDQSMTLINKVEDCQALLDNSYYVNNLDVAAGEASADDYFVTDDLWASFQLEDRNLYIWNPDNLFPSFGYNGNDWSHTYDNVNRANMVLEALNHIKITPTSASNWNDVRGQALVLRGRSFLQGLITWSLAYDKSTASSDLGIPLRLSSDFNEPTKRASVEDGYNQVIQDLRNAIDLLPVVPEHPFRASKPAACALLARTYLAMRLYDSCFKYADEALSLNHTLIDYNQLSTDPFSMELFNPEIVMADAMAYSDPVAPWYGKIDTILYASYDNKDLRKSVWFGDNGDGTFYFQNSYSQYSLFTGVANDEVYLMRAECYARMNNISKAMEDLNALMITRWKNDGSFLPFQASTAQEALSTILRERRKELVFRGLRWLDIKRLNKEGENITLQRVINGKLYTLPPNDLRYALAIPDEIIGLSGIPQNPR